jgi:hypothetical protein
VSSLLKVTKVSVTATGACNGMFGSGMRLLGNYGLFGGAEAFTFPLPRHADVSPAQLPPPPAPPGGPAPQAVGPKVIPPGGVC